MFKGYRLTYFSIIVFAVIITIGLSGAAKQKPNQGKLDLAGITANEQKKEKPDYQLRMQTNGFHVIWKS